MQTTPSLFYHMSGGILSGSEIRRAVACGDIEIDPFVPEHVNPVSVDLTLGDKVSVYDHWVRAERCMGSIETYLHDFPEPHWFDVREAPSTVTHKFDDKGIVLRPGIGYLMHTVERVHTKKYVPVLDGKSSIGRLFMMVHATAGFGDPGFRGQYTLEVTVTHPLKIYPGMRIAQMRFHTVVGEIDLYDGNYTGEAARGPVASRAWKQFLPKGGQK
jgi:dCTP deaminase